MSQSLVENDQNCNRFNEPKVTYLKGKKSGKVKCFIIIDDDCEKTCRHNSYERTSSNPPL